MGIAPLYIFVGLVRSSSMKESEEKRTDEQAGGGKKELEGQGAPGIPMLVKNPLAYLLLLSR